MTILVSDKLIDKSKEAFIMAIEIYNKPTIKYRVEGFSFFICNAWELMLKAYMIKTLGEKSIYYKDNPNRTLSLEICIQKVFTNEKDPLRKNLEKIIELRNTSTHFITEEYEMVYIPLFQACVFNYYDKMQGLLDIDLIDLIPQNFLTLTININSLDTNSIRSKYPTEIAERIINVNNDINQVIDVNNNRFAIRVDHRYYITKDKDAASALVCIDNSSNTNVRILKEMKDPNQTHKYTSKACCHEISLRLKRLSIDNKFNIPEEGKNVFNSYHFNLFCTYYNIKSNNFYCYVDSHHSSPQYFYSQQTIDFIVDEIKKDPEHIVQNLKSKQKDKSTPGAKEF